jgi:hypothetical protein
VIRGRVVTLDASGTTAAGSVQWTQVSGPAVTLSNSSAVRPSFTFPALALPPAPGPNLTYTADSAPVVLRVTATGPGGMAADEVVITPQAETISGVTARYRTRGEYRISGTTNLLAGQRVTAVLGSTLSGRVIGTATVDALGAFTIRTGGTAAGTIRTISLVSSAGGQLLGAPLTVTS